MRRFGRCARRARVGSVLLLVALACAACGAPGNEGRLAPALVAKGTRGSIESKDFADKPKLTLVARQGDPTAAVVVTVLTDLGSGTTTVLAAVVEARLRAAGFEPTTRVARDAFRVRLETSDAARARAFLDAIAAAFARPIAHGSPELSIAEQRLASLRRNPLDAPELAAITVCTGALGIVPGEAIPDVASTQGADDVERARASVLGAQRTSIGAVGPPSFVASVADAMARQPAWAPAKPVGPPPATSEVAVAYVATGLDRHRARVTLALAVDDPAVAAAAAERIGAPESPLIARLRALPDPWRLTAVTGAARPRGGCVSVVLESEARSANRALEPSAALAASLARKEIEVAVAAGAPDGTATREILGAADPLDAAARASWWAFADRDSARATWAVVLGVPPADRGAAAEVPGPRFRELLDQAVAERNAPVVERRLAVEHGQGELWLLLASPCGVGEEGPRDAGSGGVAVVAAVQASRATNDVRLEPWVTEEGLGVIAHAPFRDDKESPADLARRVADAASRSLAASSVSAEDEAFARAALLDRIERANGRQGAAFEALARAASPDHPSWLDPFGLWTRVAGGGLEQTRLRVQSIGAGPLRVAVLANIDGDQAAAGAGAVDRWLSPSAGPRVCRPTDSAAPRSGRYEVALPSDTSLAQALISLPIAQDARPFAEVAAEALSGDAGVLAAALRETAVSWSARVVGGARAAALVLDLRAPADSIGSASAQAKFALLHLGEHLVEADVDRATASIEKREAGARFDPRVRVVDAWLGGRPPRPRMTLDALRAFLAGWVRESSLIIVEARPG